jgi:hypothetical protein
LALLAALLLAALLLAALLLTALLLTALLLTALLLTAATGGIEGILKTRVIKFIAVGDLDKSRAERKRCLGRTSFPAKLRRRVIATPADCISVAFF